MINYVALSTSTQTAKRYSIPISHIFCTYFLRKTVSKDERREQMLPFFIDGYEINLEATAIDN